MSLHRFLILALFEVFVLDYLWLTDMKGRPNLDGVRSRYRKLLQWSHDGSRMVKLLLSRFHGRASICSILQRS